jgi:hypothetical protein
MLKDIAGNVISSLGGGGGAASAPSTIFTPSQILSTGLTIWYDFNDRSVLFTDTAATINVSATNDIIRYVRNKGTDRNYDLISLFPSQTSLTSTETVLPFKANDLNSNKNSNYVAYTGGNVSNVVGPLGSISATTTSGASQPSAITFSAAFRIHSNTGGFFTLIGGIVANRAALQITAAGLTTVNVNIFNAAGLSTNSINNIPIVSGERYHYITLVVDSNLNYKLFFNNLRYTGTLVSTIYPIVSNTTSFNGRFYLGYISRLTTPIRTQPNTEYLDVVMSTNTALTDDEVNRLHQYYRIKYNLR